MSLDADFDLWWTAFPRKVGKLAAQREYERARKKASAADLLDGIARYLRAKAVYADVCHPKTFLSQGRWLDEAPPVLKRRDEWTCPHTPHCLGRHACEVQKVLASARTNREA